jgi:hypothetical protein
LKSGKRESGKKLQSGETKSVNNREPDNIKNFSYFSARISAINDGLPR